MINTTGDLRKELSECFALAREGMLSGDALRGVIGCANQINTSIAVEMKTRTQLLREGVSTGVFGSLELGDSQKGDA